MAAIAGYVAPPSGPDGTTLVIGLSIGWSATTTDHPNLSSILGDDSAQYGPLSRLTGGL